jgi:hypothetical protein
MFRKCLSFIKISYLNLNPSMLKVENYRLANWKAPAADEDGKECENGK